MNDDERKDEIKRHHVYVATQKTPDLQGASGEEGKEPGASGEEDQEEGEEPDVLVDELARMYRQYVLYSRRAAPLPTAPSSTPAPRHPSSRPRNTAATSSAVMRSSRLAVALRYVTLHPTRNPLFLT